jgi:hypothetical protein
LTTSFSEQVSFRTVGLLPIPNLRPVRWLTRISPCLTDPFDDRAQEPLCARERELRQNGESYDIGKKAEQAAKSWDLQKQKIRGTANLGGRGHNIQSGP